LYTVGKVRQKIYFRAVSCDSIMQLRIINNLTHLPEKQWRRLNLAGCPFLDYRFLAALEASGCAGAGRGWQAQHLALFEGEDLAGAMPLYLKSHSAGEFVFDWAWADAYERNGFSYYPKLVCAVPFTPVAGPRLLSAAGARHEIIAAQLIEAAISHARKLGVSSLHFLFPNESDARLLGSHSGMMERRGTGSTISTASPMPRTVHSTISTAHSSTPWVKAWRRTSSWPWRGGAARLSPAPCSFSVTARFTDATGARRRALPTCILKPATTVPLSGALRTTPRVLRPAPRAGINCSAA